MTAKVCPMCGDPALVRMHGEFGFEPPANVPGGSIVVADARWTHCESCGEDFIPDALDAALDVERQRRLGLAADAAQKSPARS